MYVAISQVQQDLSGVSVVCLCSVHCFTNKCDIVVSLWYRLHTHRVSNAVFVYSRCTPVNAVCVSMDHSPERSVASKSRFASFLAESPEGLLHISDSPANKANRQVAFKDCGLEIPEASELLKLWTQHRGDHKWDFPAKLEWPEAPPALKPRGHRHGELFCTIPELKEMPRVWFDRVQLKLWEAFPRYACEAYTVDEMIIMEIIQWFHMQAHHNQDTFMCIEGMSGMGNLSRSFQEENMPSLSLDRKYSSTCDLAVADGTRNFVVATRLL